MIINIMLSHRSDYYVMKKETDDKCIMLLFECTDAIVNPGTETFEEFLKFTSQLRFPKLRAQPA
ncbi:hypothetical protein NNRS527_00121 [Nitrosospira sp. NRS527]|nr:hypothetical protein NNRS527_00121 [Nitrosospira sp. NRS527]